MTRMETDVADMKIEHRREVRIILCTCMYAYMM